jgi:hypothetical protein
VTVDAISESAEVDPRAWAAIRPARPALVVFGTRAALERWTRDLIHDGSIVYANGTVKLRDKGGMVTTVAMVLTESDSHAARALFGRCFSTVMFDISSDIGPRSELAMLLRSRVR